MSERGVLRPRATEPKSTRERRRGPRSVHQASLAATMDVRKGSGTDGGTPRTEGAVELTFRF